MIRWKSAVAALGMATALGMVAPGPGTGRGVCQHPHHHTAIARLFSGTAQVELREHFAGFAVLYGLVGTNAANLKDAISGETPEHTTLYQDSPGGSNPGITAPPSNLFTEAAADEGGHAAAFKTALRSLATAKVKPAAATGQPRGDHRQQGGLPGNTNAGQPAHGHAPARPSPTPSTPPTPPGGPHRPHRDRQAVQQYPPGRVT